MRSRTMPCQPTSWRPLLAGLLTASMSGTACSDVMPASPPTPAMLVDDIADACRSDLGEIGLEVQRYKSILVPDLQAGEQRHYRIDTIEASSLRIDNGRCVADCSGLYLHEQELHLATPGPCRWSPGDWGRSMRFAGGCAQDQREMSDRIKRAGGISVVDEANPEQAPLRASSVDQATVWTDDNACAAGCSVAGLPDATCRWNLFVWQDTISRKPAGGTSCLSDYHAMQQEIVSYGSLRAPDAKSAQAPTHAVTRLLGAPELSGTTCSAGCATSSDVAAACTWTEDQWGQTLRYHSQPYAPRETGLP